MEEFFYFPSFDLLIKTTYAKEANSLRYSSHRPIKINERQSVERYVLTEVGPRTDYYQRTPSILLYVGVDESLEGELKFYRLQGSIKEILEQNSAIDKQVDSLINESLSAYYFDKVGDEILKLKKALATNANSNEIEAIIGSLTTLLSAYNQRSGQQISIYSILPEELAVIYCQSDDSVHK
jgi:hypothetical protein